MTYTVSVHAVSTAYTVRDYFLMRKFCFATSSSLSPDPPDNDFRDLYSIFYIWNFSLNYVTEKLCTKTGNIQ